MKILDAESGQNAPISLGIQGENHAQQIVFDVSEWQRKFGSGMITLLMLRPKDTEPYKYTLIPDENGAVRWNVTNADTANAGVGLCELSLTVGDTLVKSHTWKTLVSPSLGDPDNAPEPTNPPPYEGEYIIVPANADQTLTTKGKRAVDDITVRAIPYAETSNPSGGYTVIIGG